MREQFSRNLATAMGRMPGSRLARALGVSNASVSAWLNGKSFPRTDILPAIARELNVSIESLLFGSDGAPSATTTTTKGGDAL